MSQHTITPKRLVLAVHPALQEAHSEAERIAAFLKEQGMNDVAIFPVVSEELHHEVAAHHYDMVIAVGGDGTMLRASHLCAPVGLPVLGINTGHLGFLMEVQQGEWQPMLKRLLEGDFRLECRMALQTSLQRDQKTLHTWQVFNDVVVCRGQQIKPIRLRALLDDNLMADYVADGLIVATPTGSTAYALAAGGPILAPELRNILLMPVAPHLSLDRAIILADSSRVTIEVMQENAAVISPDGQEPLPLELGDKVVTGLSPYTLCFVRFHGADYFYRNLTRLLQRNQPTG